MNCKVTLLHVNHLSPQKLQCVVRRIMIIVKVDCVLWIPHVGQKVLKKIGMLSKLCVLVQFVILMVERGS